LLRAHESHVARDANGAVTAIGFDIGSGPSSGLAVRWSPAAAMAVLRKAAAAPGLCLSAHCWSRELQTLGQGVPLPFTGCSERSEPRSSEELWCLTLSGCSFSARPIRRNRLLRFQRAVRRHRQLALEPSKPQPNGGAISDIRVVPALPCQVVRAVPCANLWAVLEVASAGSTSSENPLTAYPEDALMANEHRQP
jgi:hypothetical protein